MVGPDGTHGLSRGNHMKNRSALSAISLRSALASAALILGSLGAVTAAQADPLDLYLGAAFGQAHIRAQLNGLSGAAGPLGSLGDFDSTKSAYQAMLGIRLLSFLGAEVDYMDLGQQSVRGPGQPVPGEPGSYVSAEQVSQKGEAAFGMLYLPVPVIDVYVKAGLSRITTDMSATISGPAGTSYAAHSASDVGFAYGAGVQWKLGQWAVRGEYERFDAAGANPSLLTIGMTYWIG
jgi:opacity protein-like surface antigen